MTRSLTRRLVLVSAALGTLVLGACTSPTAPSRTDGDTTTEPGRSGSYGGSSTMCSGSYGGSSTC